MLRLESLLRIERNTKRLGEIVAVLAKYGLADWLKGIRYHWLQDLFRSLDGQPIASLSTPERVRLAFTELGTTFIKLGQILSTRPDLIGPDWANELARLQSQTRADPIERVRQTFQEEVGMPPEHLFDEFDPEPIASASIAQVHVAHLLSGEEVVVKIQHAGIAARIQADLELLIGLAELAEKHSSELRLYQPVATAQQFRRTLLRELDFTHERRYLEVFARNFAQDRTVHFPAPFPKVSSRRILTMERLKGVPGTNQRGLLASGSDLDEFARRGANMFLEMIFRDSFYHADPHPGNLMLLPEGVVGVLDCGMAGRLEPSLRDDIQSLLLAMQEQNADQVTDIVLRVGSMPQDGSRDQLRADLDDFLADYVGQSLRELNLSTALTRITAIIRKYHVVLPPALSLLLRMLIILEGTARKLSPTFSLAELIRPFHIRAIRRQFSPRRLLLRLRRSYQDWDRLLEALPRDLANVLARVRNGTFDVHLDHRNLNPIVNRLVMGILTAALFLGSSLLWSTNAPPTLGDVSIFGAMGYMIATYLGYKLLRAVNKSGDLDSKDNPS